MWQAQLLHDIIGNPYNILSPPIQNKGWKTSQIYKLAESSYYERKENGQLDPLCLMALADSLEESELNEGIYKEIIIALRKKEKQIAKYRGFWPVDWVLGKEQNEQNK